VRRSVSFGLCVLGQLTVIGGLLQTSGLFQSGGLIHALAADSMAASSDEILARVESENNRRHDLLKEYSGSRQYTLHNLRFGKQAAVDVLMSYREVEGERYTVLTRSGSDQLNGIIDKVMASEAGASVPPENLRHQITSANYRVRLLGTEIAVGRSCYVLELAPKIKSRFLIAGKAWVDVGSYAVVRIEGQFAASFSVLVGAPRISEDFVEVRGFWLPGHVRSVTSSFLLGPTQLEILFSNYQLDRASASLPAAPVAGVLKRERGKSRFAAPGRCPLPAPMSFSARRPEVRRNRPVSGTRIGALARPRFLIQILPRESALPGAGWA
jgi:hypothetical protein